MAVEVLVSGNAFRAKVRMALGWLIAHHPEKVDKYRRYCQNRRKMQADAQGHWSADRECVDDYEFPPMVPDMLRASETKSMILFGIPCGMGVHDWEEDRKLMGIFRSECAIGNLSTMRGDCEGGG